MVNNYNPKLKPYHIILLSIALCPFLIINSNNVNKRRVERIQLNENHKFLEKLYLRKLDFKSDVDAICEKGSDDLKEYYSTGDPKSIGIDDDEKIESEDNPDYIDALINIISGKGESVEEDVKKYIMHLIPVIIFLVFAVLSLPIWLVFCICCCSDCCCCCCCKKSICKIPFFIVSMAFYALVLGISIYGLSQSSSIFVGLADTECSILKFIGEVLDGETKETKPKWAGISGIKGLFEETMDKIDGLDVDTKNSLSTKNTEANNAKGYFESALEEYSQKIKESGTGENYLNNLNEKDYYLDIVYNFGTFTKGDGSGTESSAEPAYSFVWNWYQEFKAVSDNSEAQMGTVLENYGTLQQNSGEAKSALNDGITSISDIEGSFNDIKDQVSDIIVSYSDKIDEYGKLAFKIIFSVFMVLDIGIAAFIALLMFCSFSFCKNCCCFRCLFKSLLHILWNILAFLTFLVLILGSIFTLFGTLGKDLISVVSFLVSDKNMNQEEPILVGEAKNYLSKCINGNGDISEELNIHTDEMDNIDELRTAANEINNLKVQMNSLKDNPIAYNNYLKDYKDRVEYKIDDFELQTNGGPNLKFKDYLNNLNSHIPNSKTFTLSLTCSESYSCHETVPNTATCINPNTCEKDDITRLYGSSDANAKVLNAFINSIQLAKKDSTTVTTTSRSDTYNTRSIGTILEDLKNKYDYFIDTQSGSLDLFSDTIDDLAEIFNKFAGKGSDSNVYSIINCKFIGRNVKVMLKNLEDSLGKSFYTVGVCLAVSGISMLISIAFTILLNSIINANTGK